MYVVLSALALDRLETCPSEVLKEGPRVMLALIKHLVYLLSSFMEVCEN